jgi:hypothetical protein
VSLFSRFSLLHDLCENTHIFLIKTHSILGLHYLSSHKRDCLHILCRAVFMDAASPMRMPKHKTNGGGGGGRGGKAASSLSGFEVVGGVLKPISSSSYGVTFSEGGGGPTIVPKTQAFVPLLHLDITAKLMDILNSLATFSGDGRHAVVEALSCLSILKKEHLGGLEEEEDPDSGYGMFGDKNNVNGFKKPNAINENTTTNIDDDDKEDDDDDEEEDGGGEEGSDSKAGSSSGGSSGSNQLGEKGNVQTLLQKWDEFKKDQILDEYDVALLESECKWNLYAPFGMLIAALDSSTTALHQSMLMSHSKTPPPLYDGQV